MWGLIIFYGLIFMAVVFIAGALVGKQIGAEQERRNQKVRGTT